MDHQQQESNIIDQHEGYENTSSQSTTSTTQGLENLDFGSSLYAETLAQGTGGTYLQENGQDKQQSIDPLDGSL